MLTESSTTLQVNHLQQLSGNNKCYNKKALKSVFQSLYKNIRKQRGIIWILRNMKLFYVRN